MSGARSQLLGAVETGLKRIQKANGFHTDAGLAVTLEPTPEKEDEAEQFVTAVWTSQARASDVALLRTHRLTTFRVVAKVPADMDDAQEHLDELLDDIERAMEAQQTLYPKGYEFPRYQGAESLAGQIAAGWVGVAVTYTSHIPIRRPAA